MYAFDLGDIPAEPFFGAAAEQYLHRAGFRKPEAAADLLTRNGTSEDRCGGALLAADQAVEGRSERTVHVEQNGACRVRAYCLIHSGRHPKTVCQGIAPHPSWRPWRP